MNVALSSPSLAERIEWLIEGLCKVIGAQAYRRGVEAALAWAVWNRVRTLGERLIALAERVRSGRLRARRKNTPPPGPLRRAPSRERDGNPDQGEGEKAARAAGPRLPRGFGWIRGVVPETAQFAGVLTWLLRDPEMAALAEKSPQAGRILRPLCHLLGVRAPEFLRRGYVPADPPPHPTSPRREPIALARWEGGPRAERTDRGDAISAETSVAAEPALPVEAAVAVETPAPASPPPAAPPVPHHLRPGGLYWDGRRWQWA